MTSCRCSVQISSIEIQLVSSSALTKMRSCSSLVGRMAAGLCAGKLNVSMSGRPAALQRTDLQQAVIVSFPPDKLAREMQALNFVCATL